MGESHLRRTLVFCHRFLPNRRIDAEGPCFMIVGRRVAWGLRQRPRQNYACSDIHLLDDDFANMDGSTDGRKSRVSGGTESFFSKGVANRNRELMGVLQQEYGHCLGNLPR